MSSKLIVLCLILVLGVGGLFFLKSPNGTPWLSIDDLKPKHVTLDLPPSQSVTKSLKDSIDDLVSSTVKFSERNGAKNSTDRPSEKIFVYRWQDEQGAWHFSDSLPATHELGASSVQSMEVSGDLNRDLVASFNEPSLAPTDNSHPKTESFVIKQSSNAFRSSNDSAGAGFNSPVQRAHQLVKDSQKVQTLLDARERKINQQSQ